MDFPFNSKPIRLALAAALLLTGVQATAGAPTFTQDVAPIFFEKCANCHRPGEVAPMSLLTYDEARPWAKSIHRKVESREMPPWKADPNYGSFANDISLSQEEIDTILAWVDAGAPRGPVADMPKVPSFPEGWQLGEPDYIVELPEIHVEAEGPDTFPNLDAELNLPEGTWLRAVEVRPGSREVLHHLVSFVSTGSGVQTQIPDFLAVWAVGTPPQVYPDGMGRQLGAQARIRTNMHYHTNGTATTDKTRFGLYFGEGELQKEVNGLFAGTLNFKIPAHTENYAITARTVIDDDIQLVSFFPHMHTRGKSMKYTATYPDGRSDVLLNVPSYDFNWQWFYYPEEPVILPAGTIIDIDATYDNSTNNPNNPDPTIDVTFGESTYSEMMFGAFEFVPVEGVEPKSANLSQKIDRMLATYDPAIAYKVQVDLGQFKLASGFVLPNNGDNGIWYFPFGRTLFDLPVKNVQWNGSNFIADVSLLGREGLKMEGTLSPDGILTGTFDTSEFDFSDIARTNTSASVLEPKGFSGQRFAPPSTEASSD